MLLRYFLVSDSFFNIPNKQLFLFQFFTLTKRKTVLKIGLKNDPLHLETLTFSYHIQHITLHKSLVFWQLLILNVLYVILIFISYFNYY